MNSPHLLATRRSPTSAARALAALYLASQATVVAGLFAPLVAERGCPYSDCTTGLIAFNRSLAGGQDGLIIVALVIAALFGGGLGILTRLTPPVAALLLLFPLPTLALAAWAAVDPATRVLQLPGVVGGPFDTVPLTLAAGFYLTIFGSAVAEFAAAILLATGGRWR
jgi:hypothetical protein